jgi:hypothetical protein
MTPRTPRATAAAPPAAPCEPSDPLAPVAAEGDPAAAGRLLEAPAVAGLDVSVAAEANSAPAAAEASRCPVVPGEGRGEGAGVQPLSGQDFRDALKAAQSARARTQRQQRARPWTKRDPYRKAVPGGRKPPPGGEAG